MSTESLDPNLWALSGDELVFFKERTGIQDEEELRRHIIAVQSKAYQIFPYHCIRHFRFTNCKMARLPAYKAVLQLAQERPRALLLDIGCCFGADIHRAVSDGFPVENVIGSDLRPEFWELGHEMFKTTPETFPASFVPGDVFDIEFLAPREPFTEPPKEPPPELGSLTSLTPLQGHISAIHASSFFHLFDEASQLELGKRLASLLSPLPGSILLGAHVGMQEPGFRSGRDGQMFCHSPESWKELWDGEIFVKGTVKVVAGLKQVVGRRQDLPNAPVTYQMWYTITRL